MALSLYPEAAYEEVFAAVAQGLAWATGAAEPARVAKSSISGVRSKTPDLVRQEFYGWVLAHYAVRWLLHQGAARHRIPHGELSFTGHVQWLRRAQPRSGAFPPQSGPATGADGSMNCSRSAPRCAPPARSTSDHRAGSSGAIRRTHPTTATPRREFPWTARPAGLARRAARPRRSRRGPSTGHRTIRWATLSSKRTVLGQVLHYQIPYATFPAWRDP